MRIPGFTKSYGTRFVLNLPTLELPEGKISALIGHNGSGKSTFAKALAGIERTDGKQLLLPTARVGYLPQKSFAFRMSTEKNILLNGGGRSEYAAALMKALGIEALARQSGKKLSGGETAKMALCRILMGSYDLLVLDEPTAAMDMESTLAAEALLRSVCAEQGYALLLITHSVSQARRLADRLLVLDHGKLVEQGECTQILNAPKQEQTKRFLDFYGK